MVHSIRALTRGERDRMVSWVETWIERELSCAPADWDTFERGARRCYEDKGLAWPGLVRVPSPLVGMVAALPVKAALSPASLFDCVVDGYPGQALGWAAFALGILAEEGGPASDAAERWFEHVHAEPLPPEARGTLRDARRMAVAGELRDPMSVAVARAVRQAFERAVVGEAGHADPRDWRPAIMHVGNLQFLFWELEKALETAVDAAVRAEVRQRVEAPILDALWRPLELTVWDAMRAAAGAQSSLMAHAGGWGLGAHAAREFLRDVCGLELGERSWDAHLAYLQACTSAGWWWADSLFAIVSDRPSELHLSRSATGCELRTGRPAIVWRDGSAFSMRADKRAGSSGQITPDWNAYPWHDAVARS